MNTPADGGDAFPAAIAISPSDDVHLSHGMSLRDYFAAHALAGMLARMVPGDSTVSAWKFYLVHRAADAYAFADAMLAARKAQR